MTETEKQLPYIDFPEIENIADVWNDPPKLSPPLIEGVLRQGHKMLLAGPSKSGKSFALLELCIAIAEGKTWLGWKCAKGHVLYVNLELDKSSCMHRIHNVYAALGWQPDNIGNLDVWNLRGKSVSMDKLAAPLIERAANRNYIAVVIDPIYKIIIGDENNATQMAKFCNYFDMVCTELGCSVIYCHHHSKGSQGAKRSMDRASGSGVFARDPDALLDLIELEIPDDIVKAENQHERTAWRIEGTLREFPRFAPVNIWFDYPIHRVDSSGMLKDLSPQGETPKWEIMKEHRKKQIDKHNDENRKRFENAMQNACSGNSPTLQELICYLKSNETTVRRWIKKFGYEIEKRSKIVRKKEATTPDT